MEDTGVPGENHRPAASHRQALLHNVVSSKPLLSRIQTHNVSGDSDYKVFISCRNITIDYFFSVCNSSASRS